MMLKNQYLVKGHLTIRKRLIRNINRYHERSEYTNEMSVGYTRYK